MALLRLNGWEWGNKKCFMVQSHEDTAKQFNFTNSIRVYQRYQEPYAENDEKEEIYERGMLEEDDEDDYKTEYLRRITERQRQ